MAPFRRRQSRFWRLWASGWIPTARPFYGTERVQRRWQCRAANYTRRGNTLYIHQHFWPGHTPAAEWLDFYQPEVVVAIGGLKPKALSARLLKTGQKVEFTQDEFTSDSPDCRCSAPDQPATVIEVECDGEPIVDHDAQAFAVAAVQGWHQRVSSPGSIAGESCVYANAGWARAKA